MTLSTEIIRLFQCVEAPEAEYIKLSVKKHKGGYRASVITKDDNGDGIMVADGSNPLESIQALFKEIRSTPKR